MNIAICDDQQECNDRLRQMLNHCFRQMNAGQCRITEYASGTTLSEAYRPGIFDIIFLDVQMPGLDGYQTAERIRNQDLSVDIVFVTNMKDQSLMGYNYNAKGFLIKEVSQAQLDSLMHRLLDEMRRRTDIGVYSVRQKFDKGTVHLKLSDVIYFESRDKDIIAVTKNESFVFREKLNAVEKNLDGKGFLRINRSLLVNTAYVFKDFGGLLVLRTGESLPIGKNYKKSVRKTFSFTR